MAVRLLIPILIISRVFHSSNFPAAWILQLSPYFLLRSTADVRQPLVLHFLILVLVFKLDVPSLAQSIHLHPLPQAVQEHTQWRGLYLKQAEDYHGKISSSRGPIHP